MKLFLLILFMGTSALANDPLSIKRGASIGLGMAITQYNHQIQFDGVTKSKMKDSFVLIGPALNIGYDFVGFEKWLFGIKAEGYIADSLAMGQRTKKKITDKTGGKQSSLNILGRAGYLFNYKGENPVSQEFNLVSEFFVEAGLGSGHRSFSSHYSFVDTGIDESYDVNLSENFLSRILAVGINLSTHKGTYFELKLMQTTIVSNTGKFTGSSKVNGGAVTAISETLKDYNKNPVYGLLMSIGHHY